MRELAFWTRIYMTMTDNETKEEAEHRMLTALEDAGLDYLDPIDENFEIID